jgi:hypothetical protein
MKPKRCVARREGQDGEHGQTAEHRPTDSDAGRFGHAWGSALYMFRQFARRRNDRPIMGGNDISEGRERLPWRGRRGQPWAWRASLNSWALAL